MIAKQTNHGKAANNTAAAGQTSLTRCRDTMLHTARMWYNNGAASESGTKRGLNMIKERTRRAAQVATLDLDLAQRAERKLRRYGTDLNGVLALIIAVRGLPDLRKPPQTMDFETHGQTFTADVTPDPDGGYCATVRGHENCFTEADTLPELRKCLVEVTDLMLFDVGARAAE